MLNYKANSISADSFQRILTVPRGGTSEALIVSETPVLVNQHFKGRSLLCNGDDECPLCFESYPIRSLFFVAARVNDLPYLVSVPATIPENQLSPGSSVFIKRAKRNNRVTVQRCLFKDDTKVEVDEDTLWKMILKLYKVRIPREFSVSDPDKVRAAMFNITKLLERAAVVDA